MSALATYRRLLSNRQLTKLLVGEFVSSVGDWLYLVALIVLVYRETGDPVILGIIGAARMLPYLLLSVPAGILADRFDRRLVLLVSDLVRAGCMVVLTVLVVSGASIWAIGAVVIVSTSFATLFYPAIGALIPSLARDETEFGPANSLWATLDNIAWVIGPGIAGAILATSSVEVAFMLNAASFGLIAVVLLTLPRSVARPAPTDAGAAPEAVADAATTARARRRFVPSLPPSVDGRALAGVLLLDTVSWFAIGGVSILVVVLAIDVFKAGEAAAGYLNVAIGIGGTVGAIVSGLLILRPRLAPAMTFTGLAFGASVVLLAVAPTLSVAFIGIAAASAGNLVLDVVKTTILQRIIPDAYRGRLGGVLMTTQSGSEALGTLLVPMLVTGLSLATVLGVTGAVVAGVTVLAVALIGRAGDITAGPFDADLRRIARLPIFGGLSPARIEGALRRVEPIRVAAGEVVIRQGDPADRFFVVGEGRFEVVRRERPDGPPVRLRVLGRDDVFGERGLIGRSPRTATITALEPGLLFAMDGDAFLGLVGSRRGMAERFLALYDAPEADPAR
jgi:MFS family permease